MAKFDLTAITVEVTERELEVLRALASEAPWRFSMTGGGPASVTERFGDPFPFLERLRQSGLVSFQYYFTGSVAEYALSAIGRAFVELLARRAESVAAPDPAA